MALFTPQRWTFGQRVLGVGTLSLLSYYLCFIVEWRSTTIAHPDAISGNIHHVADNENIAFPDIWNSTLGFQKLMVINLPSRTDRRDATSLAAAVSDIEIEFVDGVSGDSIPEEALPPGRSREALKLSKGIRGSWRGHMNALHRVVHENLTTAMIFEDDVDWDIRLRSQLEAFAEAAQFLTSTSKSKRGLDNYPILTIPNPETEESIHNDSSPNPISKSLYSLPLPSIHHHGHSRFSPYGDPANWDLLWLGHCGAGFPRFPSPSSLEESVAKPSKANIILSKPDDDTVPAPSHLRAHPFGPLDALATSHPPHTRVYHRASGGALCTVAYAVSQRGARRLLHQFGVKSWGRIFDVELGDWCAGEDEGDGKEGDEEMRRLKETKENKGQRVCLTSQPPVFAHHHPDGGESDIGGLGGGYARSVETKYVRKSVRMNLERLVRGDRELRDQWPG